MSFFNPTAEERAERLAAADRIARAKAQATFDASPPGQARAARCAGMTIFQIDLPLSKTTGFHVPLVGTFASTSKTSEYTNMLQEIEAEGWHLEHVGYVYRTTGSVTRNTALTSGQQEAIHGEMIGVYVFRACELAPHVNGSKVVDQLGET